MDRRIVWLSFLVFASAVGLLFLLGNLFMPSDAGFTGRVVSEVKDDFKLGENLTGKFSFVPSSNKDSAFVIVLTRDAEQVLAETVILKDVLNKSTLIGDNEYAFNIEDFVDYRFGKKGDYELFMSFVDTNSVVRKSFTVN